MKAHLLQGRRVVLSLIVTLLFLLTSWGMVATQAAGGSIQGTVTSPDGYPLPEGTVVWLFTPGTDYVHEQIVPNLNTGLFSIEVADGSYALRAVPPEWSDYTPSPPRYVSVAGQPVEVDPLPLTRPQIRGHVTAPDGSTPVAARVTLYNSNHLPVQRFEAQDGFFRVGGLPAGTYILRAASLVDEPYWDSVPYTLTLTLDSYQEVTLSLTRADLWGSTRDAAGNPVAGAKVAVMRHSGEHHGDVSSASGFWAIGGLPAGEYTLGAMAPPERSDLTAPEPRSVVVPSTSNPHTLTFNTLQKRLVGQVRTNSGVPVSHALVRAERTDGSGHLHTLTNSEGRYEMALAPGLWSVTVHPISDTVPGEWVYPDGPQLIHFESTSEAETRELNLTVRLADSTVTGNIALPDGSTPPFTVTIHLHSDEGVGRRVVMQPDGSFHTALPHGGYKVEVYPHHPGFLAPAIEPIRVPPTSTVSLGTITLIPRDAMISGLLRFPDGRPAAGIPVTAWRSGARDALHTHSGTDGRYILAVTAGTWLLRPAPGPELPVVYTGDSAELTLESGAVIQNINFELLKADAMIEGTLVDGEGNPISDVEGWVSAQHSQSPTIRLGAPILNGTFAIRVPAGQYQLVAHLPPNSRYLSVTTRSVTVSPGEVVPVTLQLQARDATIVGALRNPRDQGQVVTGVGGAVGAWYHRSWAASPINPETGRYRLNVAAGLWQLDYRIDPRAPWAKLVGPRNIPVQAGQSIEVPLPVVPKDSIVSGRVLNPEGAPLRGALVVAYGVSGDIERLALETLSDEQGRFRLALPHGSYRLGATIGRTAWIKPIERPLLLGAGEVSEGHELKFQEPTAAVSGNLTVTNVPSGGRVHVWAWSDEGGFVRGVFTATHDGGTQATGSYLLRLTPGNWHFGAAFQIGGQYWHGKAEMVIPDGATASQDLTLEGPRIKPAPVAVTFDASAAQYIELPDRTSIYIPAGALPASGMVTLRILPIATLPHQQRAQVVGYGYSFLATDESGQPIEAHFNQEVVIRFIYSDTGVSDEARLRPAYFSTTNNEWTFPASYTVDTVNNQITMQIDHFTDFAVVSDEEAGALGNLLYLPLTVR